MFPRLFPLLVISLWGVIILPLPNQANAITPLTRAEIQNLRNLVQLIPRSQKRRPARKADPMIPGDGLSTGRASLADLRFNDGSLARIGEQAVFRFLPRTRNFRLSNGTVLLLIPPGRGQTRIQTPNAAAAIRGSALFVRYDQETDTTIVGALTNSGIEVSNQEASQNQVLEAGQLIVVVKGEFQGLYDFDLRNFYETSDLVRGLNLTKSNLLSTPDPAIASIQAEIAAALAAQSPVTGEGVLENPAFLQLSANSSNAPSPDNITGNSPAESFVETGQILLEAGQEPIDNNDNGGDSSPIPSPTPQPPVTEPPQMPEEPPQMPEEPPQMPEEPPQMPEEPPQMPEEPPQMPEEPPQMPEEPPQMPEEPPKNPDEPPKNPEKPPDRSEHPFPGAGISQPPKNFENTN
ncbi:FecR domain-containing protein [Nostocales cyanobacterium LEGE 11386]|nr:FecR domain-containing protein [Nostocales cyanobacterium LEGE 11386]